MIIAQQEWKSEAADNYIVRLEVTHDGAAVWTAYDSKHDQTAVTYLPFAGKGSIVHV